VDGGEGYKGTSLVVQYIGEEVSTTMEGKGAVVAAAAAAVAVAVVVIVIVAVLVVVVVVVKGGRG